jgi:hypothetical protein
MPGAFLANQTSTCPSLGSARPPGRSGKALPWPAGLLCEGSSQQPLWEGSSPARWLLCEGSSPAAILRRPLPWPAGLLREAVPRRPPPGPWTVMRRSSPIRVHYPGIVVMRRLFREPKAVMRRLFGQAAGRYIKVLPICECSFLDQLAAMQGLMSGLLIAMRRSSAFLLLFSRRDFLSRRFYIPMR